MKDWISVIDEMPKIGQKVKLFIDDVVQEDTYMYDESDIDDMNICQFWSNEDVDNNKVLKVTDYWQSFPELP
jgi:hypothetical protein